MTRLRLAFVVLLTVVLAATTLSSSVSAQSSGGSVRITDKVFVSPRSGAPEDHTHDWYNHLLSKFPDGQATGLSRSRADFVADFQRARDEGTWMVLQEEVKSPRYGDYAFYRLVFTQASHDVCQFQLRVAGNVYYFVAGSKDPRCSFNYAHFHVDSNRSIYSPTPLSAITVSRDTADNKTALLFFTGEYDVAEGIDRSKLNIPSGESLPLDEIRPNFKLSVSDRDIQVEHIKEHDRLPGYPDDEPRLMFYVRSCSERVTNREFNLGDPSLEKAFGFVKALADPFVDTGNFVTEVFSPGSPKLEHLPEIQRDRVLWCKSSQILKSELGYQGQNFKFTADKHDYYVVSVEYVFERVHKYGSSVTPDYRYVVSPESTKTHRFLDTSYVFEADGRTFSTDTFSADCRYGFCDLPPAEKDCSYEQQGTWSGVVKCHIDNVFKRFTNFFKWLFVPDGLTLKNSFVATLEHANKSFGFLALPFTFVSNVFNSVGQMSSLDSNCSLPPLSIFGATARLELCKWRHQLPTVWAFMQTVIQAGIAVGFLWACYRLLMRFFGADVDGSDDDADYEEVRWHDDRTGESGDWTRRRRR